MYTMYIIWYDYIYSPSSAVTPPVSPSILPFQSHVFFFLLITQQVSWMLWIYEQVWVYQVYHGEPTSDHILRKQNKQKQQKQQQQKKKWFFFPSKY